MANKMNNTNFDKVLSEITNSQMIRWIRSYNGDNSFLMGCKRLINNNRPLTPAQLMGLKKCVAYFTINPLPKVLKKPEKLNSDLDELVYGG